MKNRLTFFRNVLLVFAALVCYSITADAQQTTLTSSPQWTMAGGTISIKLTNVPPSTGAGTLTFYYKGDLDLTSEYFEIFDENSNKIHQTPPTPNQCGTNYDSSVLTITAATLQSWTSDGTISFLGDASSSVSSNCGGTFLYAKLVYTAKAKGLSASISKLASPTGTFCSGAKDVSVVVRNTGNKKITSVKVNWTLDGVAQTSYTVSNLDTLGSGNETDTTLKLTSITFSSSTVSNLVVWTSDPNSSTDAYTSDDTLSLTLRPALNGTFTVGGTAPDFATPADAVDALVQYGICGPVTLSIRSGTYTGRIVIPEINGSSATNTITIKGAGIGSTTITYDATSASSASTVLLAGADYVTIQDMTIKGTDASYSMGVQFTMVADHNTVKGCHIEINTTSSGSGHIAVAGGDPNGTWDNWGNYNLIQDNTLSGGYYGIYLVGVNETTLQQGNRIIGNLLEKQYLYTMYIYYQQNFEMTDNKNSIHRSTSGDGIYFYYGADFRIERNHIEAYDYAMRIYYCNYYLTPAGRSVVANNIFVSGDTYGLYNYRSNKMDIHYNTAHVKTNNGAAYIYYSSDADLRGNIFSNGGGGSDFVAEMYNSTFIHLDYNIYYTPNSGGVLVYWDNTPYYSLSAWQQAVPEYNVHSLQQDPAYVSSTDPHLDKTKVRPWGPDLGYDQDVDGDVRCRYAPTMGADEVPLGKDQAPKAGITGDDTVFVNSPVDFLGNVTAGVPHTNLWYVDGVFVKDSFNLNLKFSSTGTHVVKVKSQGCQKSDSTEITVVVVNPTQKPTVFFIADKNDIVKNEKVSLLELTSGGATDLRWEISPANGVDENGNVVSSYSYTYGDTFSRFPTIQFHLGGSYKVCLTAVNSIGSTTLCKAAYVHVMPTYNIPSAASGKTIIDSTGMLYDEGGPDGPYYWNNPPRGVTIDPCAEEVYLVFKFFDTYCGYDFVRVYDGKDNKGTPLHTCTQGYNGGPTYGTCTNVCIPSQNDTLVARSGKMYIEFVTDGSNYAGFEAFWWSKRKKVDPPTASFSVPDSVCVEDLVTFVSTTKDPDVRYLWDLDGDLSAFEGFSDKAAYSFFTPGIYTITMIATNCGGTDTLTKDITVYSPSSPGASFTADNVRPTINDIVFFSPDIKECVSEYRWSFKAASGSGKAVFVNGTGKTFSNPQVIFSDTGCYSVTLYAKNISGEDSLTLSCFIRVRSPYCIPSVDKLIADIGISAVSLHTMSNTSSQGQEGYQNFTPTDAVTLEAGVEYQVEVKRNSAQNTITRTVWIDWNQDGDFLEANEKVGEEKNSSAMNFAAKFTVPTSALTGATIMRVAANAGNLANSPCGPNRFGEYEDYRIYVTPDLTAPVITLSGSDTVLVEQGYSYTEAGATAEDNLDGDITSRIKIKNAPTFDNMIPGLYMVHFDVQDLAGNSADRVTRVVIVTPDETAPNLIVTRSDTVFVEVNDNTYSDPEAVLAEDLVDGDLLSLVVRSGSADISKVGIYILTYSVTDQNGNTASETRTIIVQDLIAPVIVLTGSDMVYHEVNTAYTDSGVTFSDNYCTAAEMAGNLVVTGNVDITQPGTYTIVYNLTDCNGNKAVTVTRTVFVLDTEAPTVNLKGISPVFLDVYDVYEDPGITAVDNYGTPVTVITGTFYDTFPDGEATSLGDFTIVYTVTDMYGNSATLTRIVRVVDREAPSISLKGLPAVNICRWSEYTDEGYELSDNYNLAGDITVTTEGDFVNTFVANIYNLRYKAVDKSGNIAYSEWRIIRVVEPGEAGCITGVNALGGLEKSVNVYPNPSSGRFTVSVTLETPRQVSIKVLNPLGQVIVTVSEGTLTTGAFPVDLSAHAGGVYLLQITAGDQTAVKRVVISK